jgi:hypothetical protein
VGVKTGTRVGTVHFETCERIVAWDRMTEEERTIFVRVLAATTLEWALADLEQNPDSMRVLSQNETRRSVKRED